MKPLPRWIGATLACLVPVCIACQKPADGPATEQPNVIRIAGVAEPPEMLLPADKAYVPTKQEEANLKAVRESLDSMNASKTKHDTDALPALDAFISAHPKVEDAYALRAGIRCTAGDLQGARADTESALSGIPRLLPDTGHSDRNELLAEQAKLAFIARDDETTSHDLDEIINSYEENTSYLTAGRVKLNDKPSSPCAWTVRDIDEWINRICDSPHALVVRGMFYAAFAPLDDSAKPLATRYAAEAIKTNPSAQAYFYAAETILKIFTYKEIAFSDAERANYHDHLIALWTKTIEADPSIRRAYAERADSYYQRKNYSSAISDYDKALEMDPNDSMLLNDRAMAKEETYDKSGAIADYTRSIQLQRGNYNSLYLGNSLENRADLYVRLGDYKQALDDRTFLIGVRLHELVPMINLEFFRKLYPEYAKADDAPLKDKLHQLYNPNQDKDAFDKMIVQPGGIHPTYDAGLRDTYLKRTDVLLALKRFDAARQDYSRAELFKDRQDDDRWRKPPNFKDLSLDVKTLETEIPGQLKAWVKPPEDDKTQNPEPTRFTINCKAHTVQMGQRPAFEPGPDTYAEVVSDFFCSSRL